jgi:hypothetical protein
VSPAEAREIRYLWLALVLGFAGLLGASACAERTIPPIPVVVTEDPGLPMKRAINEMNRCRGEMVAKWPCMEKALRKHRQW